jgi:hypothetical protein
MAPQEECGDQSEARIPCDAAHPHWIRAATQRYGEALGPDAHGVLAAVVARDGGVQLGVAAIHEAISEYHKVRAQLLEQGSLHRAAIAAVEILDLHLVANRDDFARDGSVPCATADISCVTEDRWRVTENVASVTETASPATGDISHATRKISRATEKISRVTETI